MKKVVLVYLVLCIGMVQAMAQHRNPAYDEWLRKQAIKDSLRALNKASSGQKSERIFFGSRTENGYQPFALDITASGQVVLQTGGADNLMSWLGSSAGTVGSRYVVGTGHSISVGNLYSPHLGDSKVMWTLGLTYSYAKTSGVAYVSNYHDDRTINQQWLSNSRYELYEGMRNPGVNSYRNYEPVTNKRNYRPEANMETWNYTVSGGAKIRLHSLLTASFALGVGVGVRHAYLDYAYTATAQNGTDLEINRGIKITNYTLLTPLEGNIVIANFFFVGSGIDMNTTFFGLGPFLTLRAHAGVRLPLVNMGSSIRWFSKPSGSSL